MNDQFRETEAGERYARAAFDLAGDNKVLDKVQKDVVALKGLLEQSAELRGFLTSHVYKSDVKLNGLLAVAAGLKLQDLTKRTLGVLAANRRLDHWLRNLHLSRAFASGAAVSAIASSWWARNVLNILSVSNRGQDGRHSPG